MASNKRVRPWSFWRKAFWTRPALLVLYGVAVLTFVPFGVHEGVQAVSAGRAVAAHRDCEVDRDGPCLDRIGGTLLGPFGQRKSLNDEWKVGSADGFEVGPRASSALERWSGSAVLAMTFDGDVVVIETPDGASYRSLGVGARGVVQWLCITLLGAGGAVGLGRYALRKSRAYGGWWRVEGPPVDATDLLVAFAVAPPGLCLFFMLVGAPWWLAVALTAALTAAGAVAITRVRRRQL